MLTGGARGVDLVKTQMKKEKGVEPLAAGPRSQAVGDPRSWP